MSDLSRLLDDIYGTGGEAPDADFADWVSRPEPADGDVFGAAAGLVPDVEIPPIEGLDLPLGVDIRPWRPSDDDILPTRHRKLRLRLR